MCVCVLGGVGVSDIRYQGINLEELTQEQAKQLETDSGEIAFASMGGYIYLKVEDGKLVEEGTHLLLLLL